MNIQESLDRLVDILKSANTDDLKENYPHIAEALDIDTDSVDSNDIDSMIESIKNAVEGVEEDDVEAVVEEINNFFMEEDEADDSESLDEEKDKDDDGDDEDDEEDDEDEAEEEYKGKKKKKKMNEAASLSGVMSKVGKGKDLSDEEEKMLSAAIDTVKGEARKKVDEIMKKVRKGEELTASEEKQLGAAIDAAKSESFFISASDLDVSEDVNAIFSGEELTEEFQDKAKTIFETAVVNKVNEKISQIVEEFDDLLEEKTQDIEESYAEKIDEYLDYVISEWVDENKIALQSGIRNDMMESFVDSMREVFSEHYMELPEEKVDLVNELQDKIEELETGLNEALDQNAKLNKELKESHKEDAIDEVSEGLSDYQKEKLRGLLENIQVDDEDENLDEFKKKANTVKESYFPTERNTLNEDNNIDDEPVDDELDENTPVGRYAKALSRLGRG